MKKDPKKLKNILDISPMKFPKFKDQEHHDEKENSLLKKKSQLQSFFFCLTQTIKDLRKFEKKSL